MAFCVCVWGRSRLCFFMLSKSELIRCRVDECLIICGVDGVRIQVLYAGGDVYFEAIVQGIFHYVVLLFRKRRLFCFVEEFLNGWKF